MLMTAFPGRIERHVPWDSDRVVTFILRGGVEIEEAQAVLDEIDLPVQIVDNGVIHPVNHTLATSSGSTPTTSCRRAPPRCAPSATTSQREASRPRRRRRSVTRRPTSTWPRPSG